MKERYEKEDLITAYLDGQLTMRQHTEFKRLLENEPEFAARLSVMERQRDWLRSLPAEKAPAHLAVDVVSALERRLLVNSALTAEPAGRSRRVQMLRRFASVAALIFIPLFVLGVVVFTIVMPQPAAQIAKSDSEPAAANADSPVVAAKPVETIPRRPVFSGVLYLKTNQSPAVNDFIKKRFYLCGLADKMELVQDSQMSTYKIVCDAQSLEMFVSGLTTIWPQCEKTVLTVPQPGADKSLEVQSIIPSQIAELVKMPDEQAIASAALRYTQQKNHFPIDGGLSPSEPVLAWDKPANPKAPADSPDIPALLIIEVSGL